MELIEWIKLWKETAIESKNILLFHKWKKLVNWFNIKENYYTKIKNIKVKHLQTKKSHFVFISLEIINE